MERIIMWLHKNGSNIVGFSSVGMVVAGVIITALTSVWWWFLLLPLGMIGIGVAAHM